MLSVVNPRSYFLALREMIALLTRHRALTFEMTKREIRERYAGQVFGSLWAIGHPLALMVVYVFVFAFVFKVKLGAIEAVNLDYTAYLLSGIIPWLASLESMNKAAAILPTNAGLVKQVVFPLEVLPVKGVLATLPLQGVALLFLTGYVVVQQGWLPWTYVLVPVLMVFHALAMAGISLLLAGVGAYFRDLKDVVQVFTLIGIFILPILYLPQWTPELFRPVLYANPFTYLVWCYQDAMFFGHLEHWWAWPIFLFGSLVLFAFGYRVFHRLKVGFGDVL